MKTLKSSQNRKDDHLELCHRGDVSLPGDRGLWSDINLVHNALPELQLSELNLETKLWGNLAIKAPVMLTGMTGGTEKAALVNRGLSQVCEQIGIPFGLGSQRIMTKSNDVAASFQVRKFAPNVVLLSNIGVNQLRDLGVDRVKALCDQVEADALAIHLNPAMEMIQPGNDADRDFRFGYSTIANAVKKLGLPIIVKECGCGLSPAVITRLINIGVTYVDVSGVGGTSWVKLEALRAEKEHTHSREARLGMLLADWGIPTAAAVLLASKQSVKVIASGGITNALDATKALVLGADIVGMARPALQVFLNAYEAKGEDHAIETTGEFLEEFIYGIKAITALHGVKTPYQLRFQPFVCGPKLQSWQQLITN